MRDNTRFLCDKCGGDVGNGGVTEAVQVTALDADAHVQNFYWCYDCAPKVLSKAHLKAYLDAAGVEKLELHKPQQ